jgi:hypothetical protein
VCPGQFMDRLGEENIGVVCGSGTACTSVT